LVLPGAFFAKMSANATITAPTAPRFNHRCLSFTWYSYIDVAAAFSFSVRARRYGLVTGIDVVIQE
jgi:hypothetical protein